MTRLHVQYTMTQLHPQHPMTRLHAQCTMTIVQWPLWNKDLRFKSQQSIWGEGIKKQKRTEQSYGEEKGKSLRKNDEELS